MKSTTDRSPANVAVKTTPNEDGGTRWGSAIRGWLSVADPDADDANDVAAFQLYREALSEMQCRMAMQAAPTDHWELFSSGSVVFARSRKLGNDFSFEVDDIKGAYCMASALCHSQHLRKMPDEFWRLLLGLHDMGQCSYLPTVSTLKSKSVLWAIIDEHAALANGQETVDAQTDPFLDSGQIRVSWPLRTPLDSVLRRGSETLRQLYRLNYMLYRHEYLLHASRAKNQRVRLRKTEP